MGMFIDTAENAALNLIHRNADWTGIGDAGGLRGSVAAGSLYFSACTAFPGEAASQNTNETTFTGYTRATVARTTGGWAAASGGTISPAAAISFGTKTDTTGDPLVLPYWICGVSSSGAGTALYWGIFGNATFGVRAFVANNTTNDTLFVPSHGLAANDRVAFFTFEAGGALPTGLTAGTVYFVRSGGLTTDEFTVSTTQGGAAVDITALGSGICAKIEPLILNQNTEAQMAASSLIRIS